MIGKYYKTISRDIATGESIFEISMLEPCSFSQNGILTCKGHISVFAYGIPIEFNGYLQPPYFVVENYTLFSKTKAGTSEMLNYLYDDLTEFQKETILKKIENDVFQLVKNPEILDESLKRSKNKDNIKKEILNKIKRIYNENVLAKALINYNVELNKIEMLCQHNISYDQFKNQPYLISLYHGISIYQADQFAYDYSKILPYSIVRLCGFLMDVLMTYRKAGHSCVKFKDILACLNAKLKKSVYPESKVNAALLHYCIEYSSKYIRYYNIDNEIYVYENKIWEQEEKIMHDIYRLTSSASPLVSKINVAEIEEKLGIHYNLKQKESFNLLKTSGIKILTGPPGSGKTATLKGLIAAYKKEYPDRVVKLAATTGRAAQVMTESTGITAETINKMVNVRPFGDEYQGRGPNNPVEADFIICDEISMLGTELASFLFHAIKSDSLLLLVGDEDQLQSVEYGNILQDLTNHLTVYRLDEIMRNSGAICENGQRINRGNIDLIEDSSFVIHNCTEDEVIPILMKNLEKKNTQVLSSVKKGNLGVFYINSFIQRRKSYNRKLCLRYRNIDYYVDDPVIMTETNYDKGYFNGDIGKIVDGNEESVLVDFNGKGICLDKSDFHLMMLAYCITTHKSQGSSFEHIHIILPRKPENMLTRRMLYTAVTRARKSVHIYNVDHAIDYAISNKSECKRLSLLDQKFERCSKKVQR